MIHLDPVPQVWGITGNLGGGKSLTATSIAVSAIKSGYFVVSNISLNTDAINDALDIDYSQRLYQHFSFEDEDFYPFALPTGSPRGTPNGKRVVVIMDECAEWVDQYSTAQNPKIKRFWSWLRHSSKRSQDVVLIVQRLEYLNKVLRLLISKWVIVDDMRVYRLPILKMRVPFMGGTCMQRVFDRNRRLVQGPLFVNKCAWGRFYNTAECLNSDGAQYNKEYTTPKPKMRLRYFVIIYLCSLLLLLASIAFCETRYSRARCTASALGTPAAPGAQGGAPRR